MNELQLIRVLLPYLSRAGGDLVVGAGEDDAAVWREPGGGFTVASCDTSVEQVHFDLRRQEPDDVGWRAVFRECPQIEGIAGARGDGRHGAGVDPRHGMTQFLHRAAGHILRRISRKQRRGQLAHGTHGGGERRLAGCGGLAEAQAIGIERRAAEANVAAGGALVRGEGALPDGKVEGGAVHAEVARGGLSAE